MNFEEKIAPWFGRPPLTRGRVGFAFVVSALTDALQFALGPLGWVFIDEALDILAMVLVSRAIGFHVLLLPTFVIEFIPGPDMLPTWTGCTMAVILLRRKAEPAAPPTIEVTAEVTPAPDPGVVRPEAQASVSPRIPVPPTIQSQRSEPEKANS